MDMFWKQIFWEMFWEAFLLLFGCLSMKKQWNMWNAMMMKRKVFMAKKHEKQSFENTPLKINMEHNHGGLEDHFPV